MFKLKQTPNYFWPVTVSIPADGGKFEKSTFDAEFKRMTLDELNELAANDDSDGIKATKTVLTGWRGVVDDAGEEIQYSETLRDELLSWPTVRSAVLDSFRESISGAVRKN